MCYVQDYSVGLVLVAVRVEHRYVGLFSVAAGRRKACYQLFVAPAGLYSLGDAFDCGVQEDLCPLLFA